MKKSKKVFSLILVIAMILALGATAFAANEGTGTITLNNATIGKFYHAYKLFDASYDGDAVSYTATQEQKDILEAYTSNVFDFTPILSTEYTYTITDDEGNEVEVTGYTYQVTVKAGVSDEEVIAFVESFYVEYTGSYAVFSFPGYVEYDATEGIDSSTGAASASTIVWDGVDYGYYFISSSLGSLVMIDTVAPEKTIEEKNSGETTWDNEDWEPSTPVKNVLDETGRDIDTMSCS